MLRGSQTVRQPFSMKFGLSRHPWMTDWPSIFLSHATCSVLTSPNYMVICVVPTLTIRLAWTGHALTVLPSSLIIWSASRPRYQYPRFRPALFAGCLECPSPAGRTRGIPYCGFDRPYSGICRRAEPTGNASGLPPGKGGDFFGLVLRGRTRWPPGITPEGKLIVES